MTPLTQKELLKAAILSLLLSGLSALILFRTTIEAGEGSILRIVSGTALAPFQYRVLSPLAVFGLFKLLNTSLLFASFVFYAFALFFIYYLFYKYLRDDFSAAASLLGLAVLFVSLSISAMQSTSLLTIHKPADNVGLRFPYDVTQILFFLGMAFAIRQKKVAAWYSLFLLGTFNRESTVLLLPALFLVWRERIGFSKAAAHAFASLAAWIAVKALLGHFFQGTIGDPAYTRNIPFLLGQYGISKFILLLLVFGGMWVFAPFGIRSIPRESAILLVTVPCAFAAMFLYGNLWEIRVYNELTVLVIPAIVAGILRSSA